MMEENSFAMSATDQVASLIQAYEEERWTIPLGKFEHLPATAPPWPQGRWRFRGLRVRVGLHAAGVMETFDRHVTRMARVFGSQHFELALPSDRDHLRLLKGNNSHHPVVEWFLADLSTYRTRNSVWDVRQRNTMADELLSLV